MERVNHYWPPYVWAICSWLVWVWVGGPRRATSSGLGSLIRSPDTTLQVRAEQICDAIRGGGHTHTQSDPRHTGEEFVLKIPKERIRLKTMSSVALF